MRSLSIYVVSAIVSLSPAGAWAAADPVHGEQVFKKCGICHTLEPAGKKIGPSLFGVVGRPAGTVEGFKYSEAMKASGVVWDEASIDSYLTDPKKFIPKNKMAFPGLKVEQDRIDVIEFLKTKK